MGRVKLRIALVSAAIGLAVAVPAHAEPEIDEQSAGEDKVFLSALRQLGFAFNDEASAVTAGRSVCGFIDRGASGLQLLNDVRSENPALSISGAAQFTTIAAKSYCPQQVEPTK